MTTFIVSAIVNHEHKLDMVHVQNSTLAGGVAVGSVCNMLIGPHGALLIGFIAGLVSVLGYRYLSVSYSPTYMYTYILCEGWERGWGRRVEEGVRRSPIIVVLCFCNCTFWNWFSLPSNRKLVN